MGGLLAEIVASTRARVARIDRARRAELEELAAAAPTSRDFAAALRPAAGTLGLVAELKRRSPSKGDLAPDMDPASTARAYATGGASALSVLTDGPYFGGSLADLEAARAATTLPILRKDFMVDDVQLAEAKVAGADAVLLIVAALDGALLGDLHARSRELGLAVLVEVHDEAELDRAVELGATTIGVNARNLADFTEDLARNEQLAARIPAGIIRVAESAIRSRRDAERMAAAGYDALLVGEALVRATDPVAAVRDLSAIARSG